MQWTRMVTSGVLATVMSLPAFGQIQDKWEIPSPETAEHPGAEAAPASSPTTYPDGEGFDERAVRVLRAVADGDLNTWRRGYFAGGDPGKYLPGHAMARLLLGEDVEHATRLMNDDRSHKEHYHFAAMNWGRFLPIFGEQVLTEETREKLADSAAGYTAYHSGGGTENHVTQWRTTAVFLSDYLGGNGQIGRRSKEQVQREMKEWLRGYVRGIYQGGNGEWDSSTYYIFTMNGLMNIYDFAEDEETRLLAKAGLDWFTAAHALKYRDGVYTAPNQRGFAQGPHRTHTDETGYVWYGSNANLEHGDMRGWRYTNHAITSSYRPNRALYNIATKNLPALNAGEAVEFRNAKPNYWGTGGSPRNSQYHETVYLAPHYTMASLWNGHGGQITRFMITAESDDGGIVFAGGHPRKSTHDNKHAGVGYRDGVDRYGQGAQAGGAYIHMADAPEGEEHQYSFFTVPQDVTLDRRGDWWVMQAGKAYLGVRTLGGEAEQVDAEEKAPAMLRFPGQRTGFVVDTTDVTEFDSLEAFASALESNTRLDRSAFASDMRVTYETLAGKTMEMTFRPAEGDQPAHGNRTASVAIDGEALAFGDWPVYDGRYIHQAEGVLTVHDGEEGFVVDFTGDLPEYRAWSP